MYAFSWPADNNVINEFTVVQHNTTSGMSIFSQAYHVMQLMPHNLQDIYHNDLFILPVQESNHTPLMVTCTLGDGVQRVAQKLLTSRANPNGDRNVQLSLNYCNAGA